ncbi:MAG: tRNA threonylcarbamoyl adenosine modification protein (Sua5/YciO/YrdC/YwlC family) [Limisphaerales bacterium]
MSQKLDIHPTHPQRRMLRMVADIVAKGGVVVYPTDTAFALGCHLGDKNALERIIRIRQLQKNHQFTLACRDLSDLSTYARVDNSGYRLLRRHTPGPFTFIMKASREVPRRLMHIKRRTIGMRVPDNAVALGLLNMVGEPMLTTTLKMPGEEMPLADGHEIFERLAKVVDVVLDDGSQTVELSTVIDMSEGSPEIVRQGLGEIEELA